MSPQQAMPADQISRHIKKLQKRIGELQAVNIDNPARALKAFEGLELHPEIDRAAGQLYRDGHYANAIEDAVKALNTLVRLQTGVEQDGARSCSMSSAPKIRSCSSTRLPTRATAMSNWGSCNFSAVPSQVYEILERTR
jgi:hypothetical protein